MDEDVYKAFSLTIFVLFIGGFVFLAWLWWPNDWPVLAIAGIAFPFIFIYAFYLNQNPVPPLKGSLVLRCPRCGFELAINAEFCPECGMKLPPTFEAVQRKLVEDRLKLEDAIVVFLSSSEDTAEKPTSTEIFNVLSQDLTTVKDTDLIIKLKELVKEKRIEAQEGDDRRVHYYVK